MFSNDPVLALRGASIYQGSNIVLNDINLEIDKGEFVFLVGRTGSGKSSLLKTLYADLPLHLGDINVSGYNLKSLKKKEVPYLRRKVGIVFQDFQLLPDRSVSENLTFVMKATGWRDNAKIKNRQAEVLMQVGLGAVEKKLPHQLSGGEQQRVVIARALINEPTILIADEPTGNLDPEVANDILKVFQQINKSGTAILMATHSYSLIRKFPARILKCMEGKILDSKKENFELETEN
jgi:cell division transport system ATP-binding protein